MTRAPGDPRTYSGAMATEDEFHAAAEAVKGLARDPGNDTKLRLYALYKQATEGEETTGKRPWLHQPGRSRQARRLGRGAGHERGRRPRRLRRARPFARRLTDRQSAGQGS